MTTIDCESPEIVNASRYGRKEGQAFFADFVKESCAGSQAGSQVQGASVEK